MAQKYHISVYDGREHPALIPYEIATAYTEREARRIAAQMLGHETLRGASTWGRFQGGTVFQFGPHDESNEEDFVVIEEVSSYEGLDWE